MRHPPHNRVYRTAVFAEGLAVASTEEEFTLPQYGLSHVPGNEAGIRTFREKQYLGRQFWPQTSHPIHFVAYQ